GPFLYEELNARTSQLVRQLNAWFAQVQAPLHVEACGSLFKVAYTRDVALGELLYTLLRLRGIHIWDARPCFLTTAHGDEDIAKIMLCFQEAVLELQQTGYYPAPSPSAGAAPASAMDIPCAAPRLGKDPSGHPAW